MEIEKIKKERRNSIRTIASGIAETKGAILGGAAGAIVGAATGDNIINTTGIGLGLGDMIGKKMVDIPGDMYEFRKETKELNKKYAAQKKEFDKLNEKMKNFNAGDI